MLSSASIVIFMFKARNHRVSYIFLSTGDEKKLIFSHSSDLEIFPLTNGKSNRWDNLKMWTNILIATDPKIQLFLCVYFLGPHLQHMEVPRLGAEMELQLPAYTTATAVWDLSRICNLHHSSWQCQNLNPLSEDRVQTRVLMDTSRVC